MNVILVYTDADDESHDVALDVADALNQAWAEFGQDRTLAMPATFTALSGDIIAIRWEALGNLQIQEIVVATADENAADFSAPIPASPVTPMEAPSRGS